MKTLIGILFSCLLVIFWFWVFDIIHVIARRIKEKKAEKKIKQYLERRKK